MNAARPIPFGDYLLLHRIGLGGTAEVFRAVQRGRRPGDPEVAVKRLLPHLAEDASLARMFLREVEALARIDHPNVVRLLDHGEAHGLPFLVMPLLDGASLRQVVRPPAESLPPGAALWLVAQVAQGLAAAHDQGVVHRDVSPTNVQVTLQGQVIVLDFGIARVAGMAQTTHGGRLRGKWAYLSPEQIAGEPIDGRSDLFALGSMLVELLTGTPPVQGSDPQDTMARVQAAEFTGIPGLPGPIEAPLHDLLRRLLTRAPGDRPDARLAGANLLQMLDTLGARQDGPAQLTARVQAIAPRGPLPEWDAAELRGEPVTNPALDPDVTQVRIETGLDGSPHALA
jgi:serine/threonine protein kinase